jgi:hypothetical protein
MIYFIEHDVDGSIYHVVCDPKATIVPLVNRAKFSTVDGTVFKDAAGNDLSPYNRPICDPVGITVNIYNQLVTGGVENFTYDITKQIVVPKVANATATA